jgi:hypothetical protein
VFSPTPFLPADVQTRAVLLTGSLGHHWAELVRRTIQADFSAFFPTLNLLRRTRRISEKFPVESIRNVYLPTYLLCIFITVL